MSGTLALGLLAGAMALAQIKEIPGVRVTETGTVEAIDHKARTLTLKDETGEMVTVDIPTSVQRFEEVKVGDKVTATYYDNVVVRLKKPGEAPVNTADAALTRSSGDKPAATLGAQRTMTAKIEAIDEKVPSITFAGPNGWKYSRRVVDPKVFDQLKVGDQVDVTWNTDVIVTVE
jgi:hypothetical protein